MLLIDSSAWIQHLKARDSLVGAAIARAVRQEEAATTDQIALELLAGTTDGVRLARWQSLLNACRFIPQRPFVDASAGARIYRTCRQAGETPRNVSDCLIAAIAIRSDMSVLHGDRDFDVIARHSDLRAVRA